MTTSDLFQEHDIAQAWGLRPESDWLALSEEDRVAMTAKAIMDGWIEMAVMES